MEVNHFHKYKKGVIFLIEAFLITDFLEIGISFE